MSGEFIFHRCAHMQLHFCVVCKYVTVAGLTKEEVMLKLINKGKNEDDSSG